MADEKNYFHRWWSLPTIGSDLKVIWEMSDKEMQIEKMLMLRSAAL